MPHRTKPAGVVLGLAVLGCTSHAAEPAPKSDATVEAAPPEPAPPSIESPSKESPRSTVTPLQHKPFVGALGELTGDGQVDLLALWPASEGAALVVLVGGNDGSFLEVEPVSVAGTGIALGDLDGDGDLDALILDA